MIVTIACPVHLSHAEIDPLTAPIWIDAVGNEYRVASGLIDVAQTDHSVATPDRLTIVVAQDGLTALAQMGLVPKPD